ncbi:hypothetical protein PT279_09175 [Bifidobacterium sp. ESL0784]|uniref:hypothetical protein n=1 Tax=Bifidobacterium sp. ESL0784 TaxID=2983231 RepID=UPI0023F8445C|nr:hypothetical protein [Bifidobacterium sp. ESL0784]MDF7641754.1 hypothetical protein [Bifidobacterium sp. ESL0784]
MATKVSWNKFDFAASETLDKLMSETGISYREMENLTEGEITYSRIRDIRIGRRAPVRLSEFILLCSINHCLPQQGLQMVLDRVKQDEQKEYDDENERISREKWESANSLISSESKDDVPTDDDRYRALHAGDLGLAAKQGDIEAEQQAYEEMP